MPQQQIPNFEFGDALKQIWKTIAGLENKTVAYVKDELLNAIEERGLRPKRSQDADSNPLDYWGKGNIPADMKVVDLLAEVGIRRAKLESEWLNRFLRAAGYSEALRKERVRVLCGSGEQIFPNRPFDLPARQGDFLARQDELESVLEVLNSNWIICLIEGMGGVGKTTLVLEVAYACAGQPRAAAIGFSWPRFAFIIWTSAEDGHLMLSDLLDAIAYRLGYPGLTQKSLDDKRRAVKDALAQQPVLLIIDNFETNTDPAIPDFVVWLPATVKVLLTSREEEQLLAPIFRRYPPARIRVTGLPDSEALTFLRREAARQVGLLKHDVRPRLEAVITADDSTLMTLIKATSGNPKALALALGYIVDIAMPLDTLVHDLYAAAHSVTKLLDYFFWQAWERCSDNARTLWRVIPLFAAPAQPAALAAAAGLQGRFFDDSLDELRGRSLLDIEEGRDGEIRYRAHPLVRAFASAKLRDVPEFEKAARARLSAHFLQFAACLRREIPKERYWNSLLGPGPTPVDPDIPNFLNVLAWADQSQDHETLIELMMLLVHLIETRALYAERIRYARKAAEAANILGRKVDEALFRIDALGYTLIEEGYFAEAEHEIAAGLHIAEELDAESPDAKDLIALGYAWWARARFLQGDVAKASELIHKARLTECRVVVRYRVALAAGQLADRKQEYEAAIGFYEDAKQLVQQYGESSNDLSASLAFTYLAQGNLARAEAEFRGLVSNEASVRAITGMYGLACVAKKKREISEARRSAQEALDKLYGLRIDHRLIQVIKDFLNGLEKVELDNDS